MPKKSELQEAIDAMTATITAREMEIEALKIALQVMQQRRSKRAPRTRKPALVEKAG